MLIIFLLAFVQLISPAFAHIQDTPHTPVFMDDFERYRSQTDLQKSWQAWQDGAQINVALEEKAVGEGGQAMRIEMLAPNPQNNSVIGSIYHYLSPGSRNWIGATGLRFWVRNVSDEPLLLSINFKERFNEYWAVSTSGFFLLESPVDHYLRKDIEYGNLPIPPGYSGYIVVPFASFSVPDWNTARGDEEMDLSGIETFAFGVTIRQDFPHIFILDEVSVVTRPEYPYLEIKGVGSIMVPASGEHREPFSAYMNEPISGASQQVSAEWGLADAGETGSAVGPDGWLSVPAGSEGETLHLIALYRTDQGILTDSRTVTLTGDAAAQATLPEDGQAAAPTTAPPALSEYERFSLAFENWAAENRTLFVLLGIGGVLLVLAVLSSFQKKIK